jgi:parallel beta-helix repeat protein
MKKTIALGIVFLLFIVSFTSISGNQINNPIIQTSGRGDILYVGGSGEGNYTKIQDAINDASDGDTVFVFDDSSPYYESIQIDKSINLIGENRDTTIIDANRSNTAIFIISDAVSIHGFTIQNAKNWGIDIDFGLGFCTISDNIIADNEGGLDMWSSCNNTIEGNTFYTNEFVGLNLWLSNNNTISGNTFENLLGGYNSQGIVIGNSIGNNISKNVIKTTGEGIILWTSADYNLILNNIISRNYYCGIRISKSLNNKIIGNTIRYNQDYGIFIQDADSKDNVIYHNNLINIFEGAMNAMDKGTNIWDDGEYGNYWSDYKFKYPNAKRIWLKGIWDTPYEIEGGDNKDNCPLIKQWPNDLSIDKSKNKATDNMLLLRIFERFPLLHRLYYFFRM